MGPTVGGNPLTEEARGHYQGSPCGACSVQVAMGQVLLRVPRISLVSIASTTLHTQLDLHVALTRGTN